MLQPDWNPLAQTARKIAAQDGVLGLWLGAGGKCTENLGLSAFLSLGNKHVTRQHEQKIYSYKKLPKKGEEEWYQKSPV